MILKEDNSSWTDNLNESNSLSVYTLTKFLKNDVVSCYPGQWHMKPTNDPFLSRYIIQFQNRYFYPSENEAGDLQTRFLGHLANFSRTPNISLEVVSLQSLINTGAPKVLVDRCRKQRFKFIVLSRAIHDLDVGTELFIKLNIQV
jgi:hypothetical protein